VIQQYERYMGLEQVLDAWERVHGASGRRVHLRNEPSFVLLTELPRRVLEQALTTSAEPAEVLRAGLRLLVLLEPFSERTSFFTAPELHMKAGNRRAFVERLPAITNDGQFQVFLTPTESSLDSEPASWTCTGVHGFSYRGSRGEMFWDVHFQVWLSRHLRAETKDHAALAAVPPLDLPRPAGHGDIVRVNFTGPGLPTRFWELGQGYLRDDDLMPDVPSQRSLRIGIHVP
jgi:hypothetical protein